MNSIERYRVGRSRRLLTAAAIGVAGLGLLAVVLVAAESGSDDAASPASTSVPPPRVEPTGTLGEITVDTDASSIVAEPSAPETGEASSATTPLTDEVPADSLPPVPSTDGPNPPATDGQTSTPPGTAPPPPAEASPEFELDVDVGADDLVTLTSRNDAASLTGETLDLEFVDAFLWEGTPPGGLRITIDSDQLTGSIVLPWPLSGAESVLWSSETVVELTGWRIDVGLIDSVVPATGTYCIEPDGNFCVNDEA